MKMFVYRAESDESGYLVFAKDRETANAEALMAVDYDEEVYKTLRCEEYGSHLESASYVLKGQIGDRLG